MGNLLRRTSLLLALVAFLITLGNNGLVTCYRGSISFENFANGIYSSDNNSTEQVTESEPELEATTPSPEEEEQQAKLDQFREKMLPNITQDWMKTDDYLRRWLVAKAWDTEQAEQMLLDNLKWREEQNMDTIHSEDWSDMLAEYPYTMDTEDKMGRPVSTMNVGTWNIRAASYAGKMPRLNRYLDKLLDQTTQRVIQRQAEGKNVSQWKVLMNIDGFGLRLHACASCLYMYSNFASTYESRYPGYADAIVLINTPTTFRVVINVIKPFLSEKTKKRFKIFGRDEKVWKEYLDQEIDAEQRRIEFGGTKTDPEEKRNFV